MRVAIIIAAVAVLAMAGYLGLEHLWPAGTGTLVVLSDPPGAQVWLDLKPTALTTVGALRRVTPGKHSVMVRLDTLESEPLAHVVQVRRGRSDTLRFRLFSPGPGEWERTIGSKSARFPEAAAQPVAPLASSPTADELRRTRSGTDSVVTKRTAEVTARTDSGKRAQPRTPRAAQSGPCLLEVSSSFLGARIFINDVERPEVTPATLELPSGTYSVRVRREGYRTEPPVDTIRLSPAPTPQFVFFSLIETDTTPRVFTVTTTPVSGQIYVDSIFVGEGRATVPHNFGVYQLTFGDVENYRTPEPVRLTVTPARPNPEVQAVYARAFRVAAFAAGEDLASAEGNIRWSTGMFFEGEGATVSAARGTKVRRIPNSQKFGWELAAGDPNRNPTGGDYVEFVFDLPPDVPPTTPLTLRLYAYRSSRRYALTVSGTSDLVVTVNGRRFLDGYRPLHSVEAADAGRFEQWSLQGMLVAGENRIMIRSGEQNSLYHYLWKMEIR